MSKINFSDDDIIPDDVLLLLIEKRGYDDITFTKYNYSPLVHCIRKRKLDIFDQLLEKETNVNRAYSERKTTALSWAVFKKLDKTYIEKLIRKGANVNHFDTSKPILYWALDSYKDKSVPDFLIECGANIQDALKSTNSASSQIYLKEKLKEQELKEQELKAQEPKKEKKAKRKSKNRRKNKKSLKKYPMSVQKELIRIKENLSTSLNEINQLLDNLFPDKKSSRYLDDSDDDNISIIN